MKIFLIAIAFYSIGFSQKNENYFLPVELLYFEYQILDTTVLLKWGTATELDNYGFVIQRAGQNWDWTNLGFVEGHGTSFTVHHYTFEDTSVEFSGVYYYRLKQIDNNGGFEYHDTLTVTFTTDIKRSEHLSPQKFNLSQNFPNPFNPETVINFSIPYASFAELSLFNAAGKLVKILFQKEFSEGDYYFTFNSESLPSGVYFYRLKTNKLSETKKLVILK